MSQNLIASLYPGNISAFETLKRWPRFAPKVSREQNTRQNQTIRTRRGGTEPLETDKNPPSDYVPHLDLSFDAVPRTSFGIVFGSDPRSDVPLPNIRGVSAHHFTLTYDDSNRLIVKDLGSLIGTKVTYDGQGGSTRRSFQWIIDGEQIPDETKKIIIEINAEVSFHIIVAKHELASASFINNVQRFKRGSADAQDLFSDLSLPHGPDTRRPTGAHTPGTGPIFLQRHLGQGSFGRVTLAWDVSTGENHVIKAPTRKALQSGQVDIRAWAKEAGILSRLSHPNIIRIFKAEFSPIPQIKMEYAPLGSLDTIKDVTANEQFWILSQCTAALKYMHSHNPPIVHRDIKPANLLVFGRDEDVMSVKLGDFGLAQQDTHLKTLCGTVMYQAPEIFLEKEEVRYDKHKTYIPRYTELVDVWSLGVVVYGLQCRLPRYDPEYMTLGFMWCQKILDHFLSDYKKAPTNTKKFILKIMLKIDERERSSAAQCFYRLHNGDDAVNAPKPPGQDLRAKLQTVGNTAYTIAPKPHAPPLNPKYNAIEEVNMRRQQAAGPNQYQAPADRFSKLHPAPAAKEDLHLERRQDANLARANNPKMDIAYVLGGHSSHSGNHLNASAQHQPHPTTGEAKSQVPVSLPPMRGSAVPRTYGAGLRPQHDGHVAKRRSPSPRREQQNREDTMSSGLFRMLNRGAKNS